MADDEDKCTNLNAVSVAMIVTEIVILSKHWDSYCHQPLNVMILVSLCFRIWDAAWFSLRKCMEPTWQNRTKIINLLIGVAYSITFQVYFFKTDHDRCNSVLYDYAMALVIMFYITVFLAIVLILYYIYQARHSSGNSDAELIARLNRLREQLAEMESLGEFQPNPTSDEQQRKIRAAQRASEAREKRIEELKKTREEAKLNAVVAVDIKTDESAGLVSDDVSPDFPDLDDAFLDFPGMEQQAEVVELQRQLSTESQTSGSANAPGTLSRFGSFLPFALPDLSRDASQESATTGDNAKNADVDVSNLLEHPPPKYTPDNTCTICLEQMLVEVGDVICTLPSCSHKFHLECVDAWVSINHNCPLCRTRVSDVDKAAIDKLGKGQGGDGNDDNDGSSV